MVCIGEPAACKRAYQIWNTSAQSAARTNCAGGGAWNAVSGKSARSVARVAPKLRQLSQCNSTRISGSQQEPWIFCRNRVSAGTLWDCEESGRSRSPEWVPDARTWGRHPHRRFSTFILGLGGILRRSGFHWVNKPSKSSRQPGFPKGVDTNWRGALARSEKHRAS